VVTYEYYGWGALERVTGLRDEEYEFDYDSAGRLDTLSYPGGAGTRYAYDGEGRLALRMTWDSGGAYLQADTLIYDGRGKLLSGQRASGSKVRNVYTGLGQLAASEWWLTTNWKLDEWTVDGLSHNSESRFADYAAPEVNYLYTYNPKGELTSRELPPTDTVDATQLYRVYDGVGNMRFGYESKWDWSPPDFEEVYAHSHQSAYGADQKLQFYEQFGRQVPDVGEPDQADDLRQEFRYDALGRRVLVRNLHRPYCDTQERDCTHAIERYIWDGDQLLYELRAPGDTSDALETEYGSGRKHGRVAYVHGGGIDTPLGLVRYDFGTVLLVPHADWRGQWELATDEDGADYADCTVSCLSFDWPSTAARSYLEVANRNGRADWVGSLIRDQRDPSGLLYRRNRYYDPLAGRFTQPDPIGLAGGLNVYGFAAGDPVNFTDPFGLCAPACTLPGLVVAGGAIVVAGAAILVVQQGGNPLEIFEATGEAVRSLIGGALAAVSKKRHETHLRGHEAVIERHFMWLAGGGPPDKDPNRGADDWKKHIRKHIRLIRDRLERMSGNRRTREEWLRKLEEWERRLEEFG